MCKILCVLRLSDLEKSLPHCEQENDFSLLWDNMCFFSVPDLEKYLSQKAQDNIVSTVFDIWCLVSSPETVILVSSILGRGLADTASQDQHGNPRFSYILDNKQVSGYSGQREMLSRTYQL